MSNLIIWSHQATLDYNYNVRDVLGSVARWLLDQKDFFTAPKDDPEAEKLARKACDELNLIKGARLTQDKKITVTPLLNMLEKLETLRDQLENTGFDGKTFRADVEIGGDPAISAIRGHMLRLGPDQTTLPNVCFAGLLATSVAQALASGMVAESEEISRNVFRIVQNISAHPQSVGLEADIAKAIIIYGPGRSIAELTREGDKITADFTAFLNRVGAEVSRLAGPSDRVVFAVNAGRPSMISAPPAPALAELERLAENAAEEYALTLRAQGTFAEDTIQRTKTRFKENLIKKSDGGTSVSEMLLLMRLLEDVKKTPFHDRVRTFVGTRDFGGDETFAQQVYALLMHADIISSNEAEIRDLHTAAKGGRFETIPLAYKLRALPFRAIKVCHSANGAIMDLGCRPEYIITSGQLRDRPAQFLEEVLRLSADGATYGMAAPSSLGRMANETMIRIYSHNIKEEQRQHERFAETFRDFTEPMPAGMISVASAQVTRAMGAVVGLGAVFDGLLLSFLMRD